MSDLTNRAGSLAIKSTATVFGNPIAQSKSPIIHGMFAKQVGIALDYSKTQPQVTDFSSAAATFFDNESAIGANVTMPFKHDALAWVDTLSAVAKRAGAVNTIIRTPCGFVGDNTDGYGLVTDLLAHKVKVKGANVLFIGAGGAAKGAMPALVDAGIRAVHIYNRSVDKAEDLVRYTNTYASDVASIFTASIDSANQHETRLIYDIIVNATSLSLQNSLPDIPSHVFQKNTAVYDMVYLNKPTAFLKKAQDEGCRITIDGLGMLVHQAAKSFELWFGTLPDAQPVYDYLRKELANAH